MMGSQISFRLSERRMYEQRHVYGKGSAMPERRYGCRPVGVVGDGYGSETAPAFYLDWYMDPYYKQDISGIKNDLKEMLEKVAVSPEEEDIIDEALHLLEGYTDPPYPILAAYWGNLSENINQKRFICCRGQDREFPAKREKQQKSDMESMKQYFCCIMMSKGGLFIEERLLLRRKEWF